MPTVDATMTLKQFETALRKSKQHTVWHPNRHRWNTGIRGHLRHEPTLALIECCPITAVAYATTGAWWSLDEVNHAAAELGLDAATCDSIIRAADGFLDADSTALRTRLRRCVGLAAEGVPHAAR